MAGPKLKWVGHKRSEAAPPLLAGQHRKHHNKEHGNDDGGTRHSQGSRLPR
jgi:hypothetical protein